VVKDWGWFVAPGGAHVGLIGLLGFGRLKSVLELNVYKEARGYSETLGSLGSLGT